VQLKYTADIPRLVSMLARLWRRLGWCIRQAGKAGGCLALHFCLQALCRRCVACVGQELLPPAAVLMLASMVAGYSSVYKHASRDLLHSSQVVLNTTNLCWMRLCWVVVDADRITSTCYQVMWPAVVALLLLAHRRMLLNTSNHRYSLIWYGMLLPQHGACVLLLVMMRAPAAASLSAAVRCIQCIGMELSELSTRCSNTRAA
jgi:hypothetical protein